MSMNVDTARIRPASLDNNESRTGTALSAVKKEESREAENKEEKGFDFGKKGVEGYAENYDTLTKKELDGRIDSREDKLEKANNRLDGATVALDDAAKKGNDAFAQANDAILVANKEIEEFNEANHSYSEQKDRLDTLLAAREAKLNGTEMTKEAQFASEDDTTGYSDGFAQLSVEELDARIAQKENRVAKEEKILTKEAGEAIEADEGKQGALANLEEADKEYAAAELRFHDANAAVTDHGRRLEVLEHARAEKDQQPA